ncbi:hypothetical protein P872_09790 [Rhodonellum psychrophilum GCM71 = DSM 17998]|uniref:DUF922 domain-containing protein n=2 Tax=Rhodonellum TaxID=336827 RepID=U5BUL7_9BACT|nr:MULTISPECIES: hypothetical protein [Rhodonellum]ERM81568.1 hypothetical protein P872_09790 [Rhodonellum psychrophilum GCM71 = DSM 17998]SDZ54088.1 hypothetical protein SAMN05444412_1229 [Rhodonellum ikkaensis]
MHEKLLGLLILLISLITPLKAQEISFGLKRNALDLPERIFELVEVVDARRNKPALGKIYTSSNQSVLYGLEGGLQEGLKQFYNNAVPKKGEIRRIQLHVLEFAIVEQKQGNSVASGDIKMKFAYYLEGAFQPIHLVDYEAGMNYRRSINRTDLVGNVLNQGIKKSVQFLNDWIRDQAADDRRLANKVRVEIIEKDRINHPDTVFYNANKPISFQDFRDRPNVASRFNATIFTSLSLEGASFVQEGTIILPLEVKVYMLPGSSWIKSGGQSEYTLNHEQRHFDVTKIVGNRLVEKLKYMDLNPDNYEGLVNDAFLDAFREMNRLQEIYDGQTRHGLDHGAQSRWNTILDQALEGNMTSVELELMKGK